MRRECAAVQNVTVQRDGERTGGFSVSKKGGAFVGWVAHKGPPISAMHAHQSNQNACSTAPPHMQRVLEAFYRVRGIGGGFSVSKKGGAFGMGGGRTIARVAGVRVQI